MSDSQIELELSPQDNNALRELCGAQDDQLKLIESLAGVQLRRHGFQFSLLGESAGAIRAKQLLERLYAEAQAQAIDAELVHRLWMETAGDTTDEVGIDTPQVRIEARTATQARFIRRLREQDVNFGIGPAGTGKTYLAVAYAVEGLRAGRFDRLVFCRPVLEAGERLGYLPGGIAEKVDPYMTPVYDALRATLGAEGLSRCLERNEIEIAPLAYMRGRTFDHSLILLDEAQNASREQMRMFLTRLGRQAKAVVTGDLTQSDLPVPGRNGLNHAARILHGVKRISITRFGPEDVVRSPMVERILRAYHVDFEQQKDDN